MDRDARSAGWRINKKRNEADESLIATAFALKFYSGSAHDSDNYNEFPFELERKGKLSTTGHRLIGGRRHGGRIHAARFIRSIGGDGRPVLPKRKKGRAIAREKEPQSTSTSASITTREIKKKQSWRN